MKKLVVTYENGCEYSGWFTVTVCIEYESEERLLRDLEDHVKRYEACSGIEERMKIEEFKNTGMYANDFIENDKIYLPRITTLEQWWEQNVSKL